MSKASTNGLVPWGSFASGWSWRQGEHVTLVGPTGCGKTTLAGAILPERRYVVVLACKVKDPTLERWARREGFRVIRSWPPPYDRAGMRVILWPRAGGMGELEAAQSRAFARAFEDIYEAGGWTVYADELRYLSGLGLNDHLRILWQQGRSLGITLVGATQRPYHVPLEAYDQARHLFFWRDADRRNLRRLSEIGGSVDPRKLEAQVLALGQHEALYVNGLTGRWTRTQADATT